MNAKYKVSGMTCAGCANAVTRAIQAIESGSAIKVQVDLEAGTVGVEGLDGNDAEEAIGRAVQEAGFEFGGRLEPVGGAE